MQTTFRLRKDKTNIDGTIPVRADITFEGVRIKRNVKHVKTLEKHWKNQRVKPNLKSENYNNHIEYNQMLDQFQDKMSSIFRFIHLNNLQPSKDLILSKLDDDNFGANNLAPGLFECFDEFIETNRTTKAQATIKKYTTVKRYLEQFQVATGYSVRFDTINIDFYEKFRDYSFIERKTLNNYFGKLVAIIKTFMNWAQERNYHNNEAFRKFKKPQDDIEVICLTLDELMLLYNHDFDSKRLEHVRDFYCFGCFSGLRFSDIKKLRPSHIFEDYIKFTIVKTRTIDHSVALNQFSKAILKKYQDTIYEPIPTISSQKFNDYIKECCEIVEINTPTTITRYIGQERIDTTYKKFELITSHTARKTFVTTSLYLGMSETSVKHNTGHKDDRSFRRYVNVSDAYKKQEMTKAWDNL